MIVDQMKQIATSMGMDFELASIHENNITLDNRTQWPFILLMPPIIVDVQGPSGAWVGQLAPTFLYFLTRLEQATPDKPKHEIWAEANDPMRQKALQFVNKMNMSGFLDTPATSINNTPVYSFNDATVHGNLCQVQFNFREKAAC